MSYIHQCLSCTLTYALILIGLYHEGARNYRTMALSLLILKAVADCEGARGVSSRRAAEFNLEGNGLYNGSDGAARDENADEILHMNQFPFSQENILDVSLAGGNEDAGARNDGKRQRSKRPKTTKAPKKLVKRAIIKKFPKGTPMPTVSTAPSSIPTISNQPSVSAAPSTEPTVSNQPSISSSPSYSPTASTMPSVSVRPTSPPVEEAALSVTEPLASTNIPAAPPSPVERVALINKFALRYQLEEYAGYPTTDQYSDLSNATSWYINNHLTDYFENVEDVIFLDAEVTSYYEPSPLVIDYDSVSHFDSMSRFPTQDQLDGVTAYVFTTQSNDYVEFLRTNMHSESPFSKTTSVDYSTYWEALADQNPTKAVVEQPVESSNTSTKIVAPVLAIAGTIIVIAGIFVVVRERRRRQESSRVNNNRWDENGAHLHMPNETVEENTVILDGSYSDHSCVPNTADPRLSPVHEVDSSDADDVMPEQSPSDVMREMNLSSALEDVDLNSETGGIGELPGRFDIGGIGELSRGAEI